MIAILWYARRKRSSMIPLIGGLLFAVAMFICPLPAMKRWAWVPLIADLGCAPLLGASLYEYAWKRRGDSRGA